MNYHKLLQIFLLSACLLSLVAVVAYATTNIDSVDRYAWNDAAGWLDFYGTNNVLILSTSTTGWASSTAGEVVLDCANTPSGDICGQSEFHVLNSTSTFELSGYAWNDSVGWISFNCLDPDVCSQSDYQITVDPNNGEFSGWAWNDNVGWISFNCADTPDNCVTSDYKVKTSWRYVTTLGNLISTVFDSQVAGGSAINTIMWQGTRPVGTNVYFQIAASDSSSGPWNYYGDQCDAVSYYGPVAPNTQVEINPVCHHNERYWRYKIILESDLEQLLSPTVTDIIINWSP